MLWLTLGLLLIGTICDLRRRQIPDAIPTTLLAAAVLVTAVGSAEHGWLAMFEGMSLALALGVVLFWLGALGGGDVKVLAALGAAIGPMALLSVLFYTAIAGGAFAVVAVMRGATEIPYLPAITAGFVLSWIAGSVA